MKDLVIFGTGGFAREVHQVVEDLDRQESRWQFLGFLDDDAGRHGQFVHDYPVLGGAEWLNNKPDVWIALGIGGPASKWKVVRRLQSAFPNPFATLIHPLAWVGNRIAVGQGTVICAGTLITTDVQIGEFVTLNLDCTLGHDSVIGNFATAAPSVNISGSVRLGEGVDLGTGGTIIQGISIGEWSVVGAGTVVVRDVPANVTAVGVPAKAIREHAEGWHRG